jgi:hypothetical protein
MKKPKDDDLGDCPMCEKKFGYGMTNLLNPQDKR